jgi:tol-pal system protein YbgF
MSRTNGISFVATVALLSAGCASSGQPAPQADASRDLAEMKERILELQEQAAVTDVEMARLREQVDRLTQQLEGGATRSVAQQQAPPTVRPNAETPTAPVGAATPVVVESSDLEIAGLAEPPVESASAPATAPPVTPEQVAAEAQSTALQPVEPAAQALYDRGYTLYHQGKYLDAEASFQRFLQAYPATELSDNAQFWIGESRYARGDIRGALGSFREVTQRYPAGNKVADALIKEGDCLEKLGDKESARDRYSEVMRRFPDSGAAVMAEDRLSGLD